MSVGPARAAFLIEPRSREGFKRSVAEACSRWGGWSEPIVPVRSSGRIDPEWELVLACAEVDALVNVDVTSAAAERAALHLDLPLVNIDHIDDWGAAAPTSNPITTWTPRYTDQWVGASDGDELWAITGGGLLRPELWTEMSNDHALASSSGSDSRRDRAGPTPREHARRPNSSSDEHAPRTRVGRNGPACGLLAHEARFPFRLLAYWNLRALRPAGHPDSPMVLLPVDGVQDWVGFPDQVAGLLSREVEVTPDVAFHSRSASAAEVGAGRSTSGPGSLPGPTATLASLASTAEASASVHLPTGSRAKTGIPLWTAVRPYRIRDLPGCRTPGRSRPPRRRLPSRDRVKPCST